jgi:hypothetical protein
LLEPEVDSKLRGEREDLGKTKNPTAGAIGFFDFCEIFGVPTGIRTPVFTVKG